MNMRNFVGSIAGVGRATSTGYMVQLSGFHLAGFPSGGGQLKAAARTLLYRARQPALNFPNDKGLLWALEAKRVALA